MAASVACPHMVGYGAVRLESRLDIFMCRHIVFRHPPADVSYHSLRTPAGREAEILERFVLIEVAIPILYIRQRAVVIGPDDRQCQHGARAMSQVGVCPGTGRIERILYLSPTFFRVINRPAAFNDRHE